MKVSVGIPWRGGDPVREASFNYVLSYLGDRQDMGLFDEIIVSDADPSAPFSRAASKNMAVRLVVADDPSCDVYVFHDADMVVRDYTSIIDLAVESGRLAIGYTLYRALGPVESSRVVKRGADPFAQRAAGTTHSWSLGGIIALTREAFDRVGGYDERFRGWGCEDTAFAIAANIILGPSVRVDQVAVHLWHQHGTRTVNRFDNAHNAELLSRYNACRTPEDVAALRADATV